VKSIESKKVDLKLLAATIKDLEAASSDGRFEDALVHLGKIASIRATTEDGSLKAQRET
jgi:DNA-binding NtrC family response regulator